MSTWPELKSYVHDKYRLAIDEPERFALVFGIPGGRTQQVVVTHFRALDRDFVELRTPVCREAALDPLVALKHNSTCHIGALALHDGVYYLVHKALLRTLDNEEFELPLHAMALHADTLEARHTSGLDDF